MEMEVLMNQLIAQVVEMAEGSLEVDRADAEKAVAGHLAEFCEFGNTFEEDVTAGVKAAIDEIDEVTWRTIVDAIEAAASAEVESQAKRLALQMFRDLAASQRKDATLPF